MSRIQSPANVPKDSATPPWGWPGDLLIDVIGEFSLVAAMSVMAAMILRHLLAHPATSRSVAS